MGSKLAGVLPFHRTPRAREEQGEDGDKFNFAKFFVEWIKITWIDFVWMIILGLATLGIYQTPVAAVRTFPITFSESGDIVYPDWAYPNRGWIISTTNSTILSIGIPFVGIVLMQVRVRSLWDLSNGLIGAGWSLILSALFQVVIKQLIGGFRPYFLEVCRPDVSLAAGRNSTGLNGVGFHQVMYSLDICTTDDKQALKHATSSFPSGHATAAFAGCVYLFLYVNAKMKVFADFRPRFWKLALSIAPLLAATLVACTLNVDHAHNWYDIVVGILIGTFMAFASYRASYAAVWDWRWNHIPLQSREAFAYGLDADLDYLSETWTRKAGWGGRKAKRRGGWMDTPLMGEAGKTSASARSSTTLNRGGAGEQGAGAGGRATYRQAQRSSTRGEEIV